MQKFEEELWWFCWWNQINNWSSQDNRFVDIFGEITLYVSSKIMLLYMNDCKSKFPWLKSLDFTLNIWRVNLKWIEVTVLSINEFSKLLKIMLVNETH